MKLKYSKFIYYLVWMVIGWLLFHYGNVIMAYYTREAQRTFEMDSLLWVSALVPLIYGFHLALLEGLPRTFKVNLPLLLLVFLPCFLLLIYPASVMYFRIDNVKIPMYITTREGLTLLGIVSGFTLIRSLTTSHKNEILATQ